jgi:hypothetical protein
MSRATIRRGDIATVRVQLSASDYPFAAIPLWRPRADLLLAYWLSITESFDTTADEELGFPRLMVQPGDGPQGIVLSESLGTEFPDEFSGAPENKYRVAHAGGWLFGIPNTSSLVTLRVALEDSEIDPKPTTGRAETRSRTNSTRATGSPRLYGKCSEATPRHARGWPRGLPRWRRAAKTRRRITRRPSSSGWPSPRSSSSSERSPGPRFDHVCRTWGVTPSRGDGGHRWLSTRTPAKCSGFVLPLAGTCTGSEFDLRSARDWWRGRRARA